MQRYFMENMLKTINFIDDFKIGWRFNHHAPFDGGHAISVGGDCEMNSEKNSSDHKR